MKRFDQDEKKKDDCEREIACFHQKNDEKHFE
jgi:hypothetical protein